MRSMVIIMEEAKLQTLAQIKAFLEGTSEVSFRVPKDVPIGKRRAPQPNNMPGYIRIDSVHQGDQDGAKGVYHINAVDCVTQMEFVATCEKISEAFLLRSEER